VLGHDIIVIGASAGGVEALPRLIASLPGDLPAAIFPVLHLPARGPDLLAVIVGRHAAAIRRLLQNGG
jgi:two-component system chemotaxis response regulator CheB